MNHKSMGGINIMLALLLITLALGSAMYSANSKLLNAKLNEANFRKTQSIIAAQSGLQHALSTLSQQPVLLGTLSGSSNDKFSIDISPTIDADDQLIFDIENPKLKFRTIIATGYSDDKTATSNWHSEHKVEQKVIIRPIIALPVAPITTNQELEIRESFMVGAKPNGRGSGVPISIYNYGALTMTGHGATCSAAYFNPTVFSSCQLHHYSKNMLIASDIISNTSAAPPDLLKQTFGYPREHYLKLKDLAHYHPDDCTTLDSSSTGFYWITGNCNLSNYIGTASSPVILVIEQGNIELDNATIYGVIYSFSTDLISFTPVLSMQGDSSIIGALILDGTAKHIVKNIKISYQVTVSEALIDQSSNKFSSVHPIYGSWKDF